MDTFVLVVSQVKRLHSPPNLTVLTVGDFIRSFSWGAHSYLTEKGYGLSEISLTNGTDVACLAALLTACPHAIALNKTGKKNHWCKRNTIIFLSVGQYGDCSLTWELHSMTKALRIADTRPQMSKDWKIKQRVGGEDARLALASADMTVNQTSLMAVSRSVPISVFYLTAHICKLTQLCYLTNAVDDDKRGSQEVTVGGVLPHNVLVPQLDRNKGPEQLAQLLDQQVKLSLNGNKRTFYM